MRQEKNYIIIVAGGKGLRMGGDVPKQFLPVGGMPVLMRTLLRFHQCDPTMTIILVLPQAQQEYWRELCREYRFALPLSDGLPEAESHVSYLLANGGATRFHSVQNGLALIPDDARGLVGVHDGVRPFVAKDVIRRCYEEAHHSGAAIPVVSVVETLRHIPSHKNVLRSDYCLVQTPQVFDIQLLKAANKQPYDDAFTDDASVVESFGHQVAMVEGNRENIKITTPFDLKTAETIINTPS